jgi:hypothetical protein
MSKRDLYVLCLSDDGYKASLEVRKVYARIRDAKAEREGLVRVVDDSGDDYLYPRARFAEIDIPPAARSAFATPEEGKAASKRH